MRNRFGVIKAKVQLIVLDRQTQAVSHEFNVPLHSLGTDFKFVCELPAIRITTGFQTLVHAHHAFERRTRIKAGAAAGWESDAFHSRGLRPDTASVLQLQQIFAHIGQRLSYPHRVTVRSYEQKSNLSQLAVATSSTILCPSRHRSAPRLAIAPCGTDSGTVRPNAVRIPTIRHVGASCVKALGKNPHTIIFCGYFRFIC